MKRLACLCLLPLLAISACRQTAPQAKASAPTVAAEAMVANLYKAVTARQQFVGLSDRKAFAPYFSKALLHLFDDNDACFEDWKRQNPGTTDKPPFAIELGIFSGGSEQSEPQTFSIEKTESRKDGSLRVYVKLALTKPYALVWHVGAVVVRESGRPVVDDIIYLKDEYNDDEGRLSRALMNEPDCKGPRFVGWRG